MTATADFSIEVGPLDLDSYSMAVVTTNVGNFSFLLDKTGFCLASPCCKRSMGKRFPRTGQPYWVCENCFEVVALGPKLSSECGGWDQLLPMLEEFFASLPHGNAKDPLTAVLLAAELHDALLELRKELPT